MTLAALPIGLLVAFQLAYLPYHDTDVTGWHRTYIVIDVVLLAIFAVLRRYPDRPFGRALGAFARAAPGTFVAGLTAGVGAISFALAVATIPGEWIDRTLASVEAISAPVPYEGLGNLTKNHPPGSRGRRAFLPTAYLFEGQVDDWRRATASVFARNLVLIDEELSMPPAAEGGFGLSLRGRDLNFATFDRSILRAVDFSDSWMKGASLVETDLSQSRLVRVPMQGAI